MFITWNLLKQMRGLYSLPQRLGLRKIEEKACEKNEKKCEKRRKPLPDATPKTHARLRSLHYDQNPLLVLDVNGHSGPSFASIARWMQNGA